MMMRVPPRMNVRINQKMICSVAEVIFARLRATELRMPES